MKGVSTGYLAKLQAAAAGVIAGTGHPVMQQRKSHQLFQGCNPIASSSSAGPHTGSTSSVRKPLK
jgi:hypothetical protein